ncbi:MAG TPA: flavodoxin domain-containing protein [Chitinivibrionales bacterium]|nr:flavodoxin domain-containing protein [Chitinivibrionales bacterium]
MADRALVAYASRTGSTNGIANAIAKTLCVKGISADVSIVNHGLDLSRYSTVVVGSPVRAGFLMREARAFVRKNRAGLAGKTVAYFCVCMTMKEDTPKNRAAAEAYLRPLVRIRAPDMTGVFAGAFDLSKLGGFFGWVMRRDKSGKVKTEDCRDWNKIAAWSESLATMVLSKGGAS